MAKEIEHEPEDGGEENLPGSEAQRVRLLGQSLLLKEGKSSLRKKFLEPGVVDRLDVFFDEEMIGREQDAENAFKNLFYGLCDKIKSQVILKNQDVGAGVGSQLVPLHLECPVENSENVLIKKVIYEYGFDGATGSYINKEHSVEDYFFAKREDGGWYGLVLESDGIGRLRAERLHLLDNPSDKSVFSVENALIWVVRGVDGVPDLVGVNQDVEQYGDIKGRQSIVYQLENQRFGADFRAQSYYLVGDVTLDSVAASVKMSVDLESRLLSFNSEKLDEKTNERIVTTEIYTMLEEPPTHAVLTEVGWDLINNFGSPRWPGLRMEMAYKAYADRVPHRLEVYVPGYSGNVRLVLVDAEAKVTIGESVFADFVNTMLTDEMLSDMQGVASEVKESGEGGGGEDFFQDFSIWEADFVEMICGGTANKLYLLTDKDGFLMSYKFMKE